MTDATTLIDKIWNAHVIRVLSDGRTLGAHALVHPPWDRAELCRPIGRIK
jgi:hypothetical protein